MAGDSPSVPGTGPPRRVVTWGLAFGSAVLTCLFLEFVGFRFLLPHLPLKVHVYLPREIRVLAQPSKRSAIPRDYIALVGDSYAYGYGEWLLETDSRFNRGFHSADVIHQATGRDVVTFGAAGAGSLTGLVAAPIGRLRYLDASWLYSLAHPRVIVVYFYSGNDFNDNLKDLELRFHPNFPGKDVQDREVFRSFLTTVVLGRDPSWVEAESGLPPTRRLFFTRTLWRIWRQAGGIPWVPSSPVTGGVNRVIVGGRTIAVPDLHSPGLQLGVEEIALATHVFEEGLLYLKRYFSNSAVRVVYIPSALECYQIASPEIDIETYEGRRSRHRVEELERRHRLAVTAVQNATERNGLAFVDATPYLKSASRSELVHGPKDWHHFNRAGYEALARAVLTVL